MPSGIKNINQQRQPDSVLPRNLDLHEEQQSGIEDRQCLNRRIKVKDGSRTKVEVENKARGRKSQWLELQRWCQAAGRKTERILEGGWNRWADEIQKKYLSLFKCAMQQLLHSSRWRASGLPVLYRLVHFTQKANISAQGSKEWVRLRETQIKNSQPYLEPVPEIRGAFQDLPAGGVRHQASLFVLQGSESEA